MLLLKWFIRGLMPKPVRKINRVRRAYRRLN